MVNYMHHASFEEGEDEPVQVNLHHPANIQLQCNEQMIPCENRFLPEGSSVIPDIKANRFVHSCQRPTSTGATSIRHVNIASHG